MKLARGHVTVLSRNLQRAVDPVALFAALAGDEAALLESADARVSGEPAQQTWLMTRAALRLTCKAREVTVTPLSVNGENHLSHIEAELGRPCQVSVQFDPPPKRVSERERLAAPSVFDVPRATLANLTYNPMAPPLLVGSFAYDLIDAFEELPGRARPSPWPDYELWLPEELVRIDHARRQLTLLRFVYGGERAEEAYHDASQGLAVALRRCDEVAPLKPSPPEPGSVALDMDDDAYAALVTLLKRNIVAGDVFQIVPSRTFSLPCADPLAAYVRLRALNPSPYMFFVRGSQGTLFGASPESAVAVRDRRVTINPIAGTRRRGRRVDAAGDSVIDHDRDSRIEAELRLDEKEVAEHMMLVDLARNDVARVSQPGSRKVDRLLDVVRYSHVMHLVSEVSGELRPELDPLHAYQATMNMGTLVGAPKIEAARLLAQHETTARGPYGGGVGYLTAAGIMDTCIVIRSALVIDGVARVRAGAGVVHDSLPHAEADETSRKAAAVLQAIAGRAS